MTDLIVTPFIRVEDATASYGHYVYLGETLIGFRPHDGTRDKQEVAAEVSEALAKMLSDRLQWPSRDPEEETEEPIWTR